MFTRIRSILAAMAVFTVAGFMIVATQGGANASPSSNNPPPGVKYFGNTSLIHKSGLRIMGTHIPHPKLARNTLASSTNWSGYADQACSTCSLRYVNVSFTVPSVNCTGATTGISTPPFIDQTRATSWVGLDGWFGIENHTVEQTGVDSFCDFSNPVYLAWYEMYPLAPQPFTITGLGPGDAINVNVFYNSSTHMYQIYFKDITQNVGFTTNQPCPTTCYNKSAEVITENAGGSSGTFLADFGNVFFHGATVTSRSGIHGNLDDTSLWKSYLVNMIDGTSDVLASPGPLFNFGTNSSFADTWFASS